MKIRATIRLELPPENVLVTKDPDPEGTKTPEFQFLVALSSSLGLAFIMGVMVQIRTTVRTIDQNFLQCQVLDPKCPYGDHDERLLQRLHAPQYPLLLGNMRCDKPTHMPNQNCHQWLRCFFSPCERYLTALKGEGPPCLKRQFSSWILEVYHRVDQTPQFSLIAISGVHLHSKATHPMIFHPTKPLLALCLMSITAIWRFTSKG